MYIALIILIILFVIMAIIYNTMLSKKNKMLKAYSSLDVMLKKRYDLIPNIVETVKGYKEYESSTLKKITGIRSKADECKSVEDMTEVAKIIASAIFSSDNELGLKNLRERSLKLCKKYPIYKG